MNLKQSRCVSIFMSQGFVKAAQVTSLGVVEKLARNNVDQGGVDAALRRTLVGFDLKKSALLCLVPGDVATTKNLEVPSADPEEIESIVTLQASRFTPFSKDEILTSYIKLGASRPNFTRVLVVVVKRDAVKDRLAWLKSAGVNADSVIFVPEAIARFYGKSFGALKTRVPVGLVDVNRESTNFMILAQGTVAAFRNVPVGIARLSQNAEAKAELIEGIKASVDAYEQEGLGGKPAQFYLTTHDGVLDGFDALLTENLGATASFMPYTNMLRASPVIQGILSKDFADESALDVIAAASMASKCEADIVPQEVRDHRVVAEKGRQTLQAGILVLVSLVFIGGALLSKVYFKDRFLKQNLIAKYSEQRQEVQNLEKTVSKTRILRHYLEARTLPLDALRELFRIIPPEIYLSSITKDEDGSLSVQGVSESMSKVFAFVTALEEAPLFEGVKTKSTTAKKDRGKDVAGFEITMKIVSDPSASPEQKKVEKK